MIGGTLGFTGDGPAGMNQAFLTISTSSGSGNTDESGNNNSALLDPANLGQVPNGVQYVTDGSLPL